MAKAATRLKAAEDTALRVAATQLIDAEIDHERSRLRACVGKIDALRSLSFIAERLNNREERLVSFEELFSSPRDELERAELDVLAARLTEGNR